MEITKLENNELSNNNSLLNLIKTTTNNLFSENNFSENKYFNVIKFLNYLLIFVNKILDLINELEIKINESFISNDELIKIIDKICKLNYDLKENLNKIPENQLIDIFYSNFLKNVNEIIILVDKNDFSNVHTKYSNIKLTWTLLKIELIEYKKEKEDLYKSFDKESQTFIEYFTSFFYIKEKELPIINNKLIENKNHDFIMI